MKIKVRITTVGGDENSYAQIFEVSRQQCVIGRQGADVVLPDPGCSRRHAMLYEGPQGELRVMDLHSTNGTYIDKERVIDRQIVPGVILRMGAMMVAIVDYVGSSPSFTAQTVSMRQAPPPLPRKRQA